MTSPDPAVVAPVLVGLAVVLALAPRPAGASDRAAAGRPDPPHGPGRDRRRRPTAGPSAALGALADRLVAARGDDAPPARTPARRGARPAPGGRGRPPALVAGFWHPAAAVVVGAATWAWCRARGSLGRAPPRRPVGRRGAGPGRAVPVGRRGRAQRPPGGARSWRRGSTGGWATTCAGSRHAWLGASAWPTPSTGWPSAATPVRPLAARAGGGRALRGSRWSPVLERLSVEARMVRRRRAEEAARRLPVQLLFPLVLCVLPAFVLLAVVPLLLAAVPQLPR